MSVESNSQYPGSSFQKQHRGVQGEVMMSGRLFSSRSEKDDGGF